MRYRINKEYTIWDSFVDIDDWKNDLKEEYPNADDWELMDIAEDINASYLDDERANLNIYVPEQIIAIADIGCWDGRKGCSKIVGRNVSDCLRSNSEMVRWIVDHKGDLIAKETHHGGYNTVTYRAFKPGTTRYQVGLLQHKIAEGTATRADITKITRRLGDDIAAVYGWKIDRQRGRKVKN